MFLKILGKICVELFIGKIKMTVGIRRRTKEKVQYRITAIRNM